MIAASSLPDPLISQLDGRSFRISGCEGRINEADVEVSPDESVLIRVEYTCGDRSSRFEYLLDEIPPYEDQRPVPVASAIAELVIVDLVESHEAFDAWGPDVDT